MNNTSDAYRWIDANADELIAAPDEGFDWIYMLTECDWKALNESWDSRTQREREAIAYIVCQGPSIESRDILLRALREPNRCVARQAAQSLRDQHELDGVEFPPLDPKSAKLVEQFAEDD